MRPPPLPPSRCPRCAFRRERCICAELPAVRVRARLGLLQHAKDARRSTNTGRLLAAIVDGVECLCYGLPGQALDLPALAARTDTVCLFPHEDAEELSPALFENGARPGLLLLDGTWSQGARLARKLRHAGLRPGRLPEGPPGAYRLRNSGDPRRLCTIEAAARALAALGEEDAARSVLEGFELFVARHLAQR